MNSKFLPVLGVSILFLLFAWSPSVEAASTTVVISEVYGGAGCGTAGCSTYQNDYIELHNIGVVPVSLNGWSVQYTAATGTAWQVTPLTNVTLQPGQYFLVAESFGANGLNPLPTPDVTGTIAMSATAAKVALVNTTTALSGSCPTGATIVDFVGYGATASCFEGAAPAPAPSTTTSDVRAGSGCVDRDQNGIDFRAQAPNPQNTASPSAICTLTAAPVSVSGRVLSAAGTGVRGARVTMVGDDGVTKTAIANAFGYYTFNDVASGRNYMLLAAARGYLFSPRNLNVDDQLTGVDLISQ
jgi:predicted extracellular nuclease